MDNKIVIEIIHTRDFRRDYKTFSSTTVSIGRGFNNDLIISDPYISESHLEIVINEDGWTIQDLNSHNGVLVNGELVGQEPIRLKSGDRINLGKTRLKVIDPSHHVPPPRDLITKSQFLKKVSKPTWAWGMLSLVVALFVIEEFMQSPDKLAIEKIFFWIMMMIVIVCFWASIWAFVGRLIKHRMQFHAQLAVSSMFMLTTMLLTYIINFIGYYVNNYSLVDFGSTILYCIVFAWFFVLNIAIATDLPKKNQKVTTSVIALVMIMFFVTLYVEDKSNFSDISKYNAILKPPLIKIKPSMSIDQFIDSSDQIFKIVIND